MLIRYEQILCLPIFRKTPTSFSGIEIRRSLTTISDIRDPTEQSSSLRFDSFLNITCGASVVYEKFDPIQQIGKRIK